MTFIEHDRVEKWLGRQRELGVVVKALNHTTREYFLIVWIEDGPRKNTREYTSRGWRPLLDWDGPGHLACRCRECERPFRAPLDAHLCRTCATLAPREPPVTQTYQAPDDPDIPF